MRTSNESFFFSRTLWRAVENRSAYHTSARRFDSEVQRFISQRQSSKIDFAPLIFPRDEAIYLFPQYCWSVILGPRRSIIRSCFAV